MAMMTLAHNFVCLARHGVICDPVSRSEIVSYAECWVAPAQSRLNPKLVSKWKDDNVALWSSFDSQHSEINKSAPSLFIFYAMLVFNVCS